ncbi:hypothetical protein BGW80DRAFT_1362637, partial [Lactifluus volemus]
MFGISTTLCQTRPFVFCLSLWFVKVCAVDGAIRFDDRRLGATSTPALRTCQKDRKGKRKGWERAEQTNTKCAGKERREREAQMRRSKKQFSRGGGVGQPTIVCQLNQSQSKLLRSNDQPMRKKRSRHDSESPVECADLALVAISVRGN